MVQQVRGVRSLALRSFCAVQVAVGCSVTAVDDASTVVRDDEYDEQPELRTLFLFC
jgi:hypothetical protein